MWTRRQFLERSAYAGAAAATPGLLALGCGPDAAHRVRVNDVHSRLNATDVVRIERPGSIAALQGVVRAASASGEPLCIAAGRHAMGGQQFASDAVLVDMGGVDDVIDFDPVSGQIEVGAGIQWPALIDSLHGLQEDAERPWGIVQKQTGADRLSLGGALAANAHGRGLQLPPIVGDVESFTLIGPDGQLQRASRTENRQLFANAIGGYGLFGPIASVRLRLSPRRKLERVAVLADVADVERLFDERVAQGFLYGDFQYSTDLGSDTLLRKGVLACYRPVDPRTPILETQAELSHDDWLQLITLAHTDRTRAFEEYTRYYVGTSGQVYWSDTHQLSTYIDDYHTELADLLGPQASGTEMITELYTPRGQLAPFLEEVRAELLANDVDLIYGTIRLIERDAETFLPWAQGRQACVIFNLHVEHDPAGLARAQADFRRLIGTAQRHGGAYFLTYHRWASREQVLASYPQLPEFLRRKRAWDPEERFSSDWYRHYTDMFSDVL